MRNRIEGTIRDYLRPAGELQPGYFHPLDVAANAPESAWFATSNDEGRSNNVASQPTTALNNLGPLRGSPIVCTLGNGVFVFCSVRKPVVFLSKTC